MSPPADRYAVIGNPIAHSKSPLIHAAFARATGQSMAYSRIEGRLDHLGEDVAAFRTDGGKGMNVTMPFKVQAFKLATHPHPSARVAGAANALKFDGDRIEAQNFDGSGLCTDIECNLGLPLRGQRVLILGAGGAARGIVPALLAQGVAEVVVANRTLSVAHAMAQAFSSLGPISARGLDDLAHPPPFGLVINATPASLQGTPLSLPSQVFRGATLAYELAYGQGLTPFLQSAQQAGVGRLADGVGMLVEQAAEAFFWWRGVRPATRPVIDMLASPLQ